MKEIDFDKSLLEMIDVGYYNVKPSNINEADERELLDKLRDEIKLRVMDLNEK